MGKCERCGGDIAVMPIICWKCFYSFWKTTTPEQAELIKRIQNEAVDNFAAKVKEAIYVSDDHPYNEPSLARILNIIDNTLKNQED